MLRLILIMLLATAAWSQTFPQPPLIQLKEYLQLTDSQYSMLFQNMGQYQRGVSERQVRIGTLMREIALETARDNPDPTELGTRYVEIESICRALNDEAKQLQERNRALLTDPQKTRLKTLEDAWKLYPTISQAQQVLLLDGNVGFPLGISATIGGTTGAITPSLVFPTAPGCSARRTGDFAGTIAPQ